TATVAAADEAATAAAAELVAAQQRRDDARRALLRLADRDEADRLAARLARIDALTLECAEITAALQPIILTDKIFGSIERAAAAVDIVRAQVDLTAPRVELTAESPVEVTVGERTVELAEGQSVVLSVPEASVIRLPGVLAARIDPGATAAETSAKLVLAEQHLQEQLTAGAVSGLEEARALDQRRRELTDRRNQCTATLEGLCGDDEVVELRARLAALRDGGSAGSEDAAGDLGQAQAELGAAEADLTAAHTRNNTQQKVAAAAAAQLGQRSAGTQVCQAKVTTAQAELTAAQERLNAQRAAVGDDEIALRAREAADVAVRVAAEVQQLSARLAEAGPEAVDAELAAARAVLAEVRRHHDRLTGELRDVNVALTLFGSEGRSGKLDAAQICREHAASTYGRVHGRARAAQMLRTVMVRHRDDTRQRYVDPFRTEIERLGRVVFGPTFEVEVDSDLQIRHRTLDGRTVPYESLSGGAKEQLGIVARLAVASLVDAEDSVPVVIDDALGFTDPGRLVKMNEVLDVAGARGQVIVLTCSPDRYEGVDGAHRVEVTAGS
ncbi:MAG: hypothetical protein WBB07_13720, partial [Mycobacterium sp.]